MAAIVDTNTDLQSYVNATSIDNTELTQTRGPDKRGVVVRIYACPLSQDDYRVTSASTITNFEGGMFGKIFA